MSPPDPDQGAQRAAFSWESVVGDGDASEPTSAPEAAVATPDDVDDDDLVVVEPIALSIAPLSLEPLPPVPPPLVERSVPLEPTPPVLGEMHIELNDVDLGDPVAPSPAAPPAPSVVATDVADTASVAGPAPASAAADVADALSVAPPAPASDLRITSFKVTGEPAAGRASTAASPPAEQSVTPPATSPPAAESPVAEPPSTASAPATGQQPDPVAAAAPAASSASAQHAAPVAEPAADPASHAPSPTLPTGGTAAAAAPTIGGQPPSPTLPGAASPVVGVAAHQPSQASGPRLQAAAVALVTEPEERGGHKQRKRAAKKKVKVKQESSSAGGLALFFTLLVLAGLIAGAIVFGRPYLFPDDWDAASLPYAEAVETVRGTDIAESVMVTLHAPVTYDVTMADELMGPWREDLPMWRSFGLANGEVDESLMREILAGWMAAFYSPSRGEIVADDSLPPAAVDGAIVEAMVAAAVDQETAWSAALDQFSLDASAMLRAQVFAAGQDVATATSFGAARSERRIDVAEFLPAVISYRVNAPIAFAQVVADDAARLDAIVEASRLEPAGAPEVLDGDTVVSSARVLDRGFWYLVFAAYVDASAAYEASNGLVEASLTTADRAGVQCSYATFSGGDLDGTGSVAEVLQQWVATAPAEMGATMSALADGSLQLVTCDPGVGFDGTPRFGVARELTRWRLVELAAVEAVDPVAGTPETLRAAIDGARDSQAALTMMGLPYATSAEESARLAREAAADTAAVDPADPAAVAPADPAAVDPAEAQGD